MSEKMYPIPFKSLMNWIVTEYAPGSGFRVKPVPESPVSIVRQLFGTRHGSHSDCGGSPAVQTAAAWFVDSVASVSSLRREET